MDWWRKTSLTTRVPLMVAVLMLLMGIAVSQLVISALIRSQERQLKDLAQVEFEGLASALGLQVMRNDIWEMFDILDRATQRQGSFRPTRATLVDALGRVVVSSAPERHPIDSSAIALINGAMPVEQLSYDRAAEFVTLRSLLLFQDRPFGQIVITFDVRELVRERRSAWSLLVWGTVAVILVLSLVGYLAAGRLLSPIRRLAHQMGQSSGEPRLIPDAMIPVGDTEMSQLYQTYNGMIRAVQARVEAERRLAERERFVSLGRLAGSLAHEINNPLGGLLNAVDTIRRYPTRPEVVAASADLLDRALKHLRDVVRVTLDTHRNDHASEPLTPKDFDDLHLLLKPEAERQLQDLEWQVDLPETGLGKLQGGAVRQILLNLLLNAAATAGKGGAFGLKAQAQGNALQLEVWDTGPGLPEHLQPRLLSDVPIEAGGGVGLRLVRELVIKLGGEVHLGRSLEGHHAIRVVLPLGAAALPECA